MLFLPHGCRRGSWLSRCWFYFHVGMREAGGALPPQQYFLITCQKTKQNKMQRGSPALPSPCLGPGALDAFLHSFSTAISLPGPPQGHAIVVFFILISHFKMRNKRIFNEPSQQACVCFILVSGDGGSPQGLLVSLPASAPPPQGGGRKRGPGGGHAAVPSVPGQSQPVANSSRGPAAGEGASRQVEPLPPAPP